MQYPVALQLHNFISAPSSPEPSTPLPENTAKVIKITNCRVLKDRKIVEKDAIWIQDGKIIDPHKFFWYQKRLPDVVLDAEGLLVVPGFIEAQINGNDISYYSTVVHSLTASFLSYLFLVAPYAPIPSSVCPDIVDVLLSGKIMHARRPTICAGRHPLCGLDSHAPCYQLRSRISCEQWAWPCIYVVVCSV
jgi:hypothetical protein